MLKDTSLPNFMLFRVGHHHFLVIFRFFPMMTSSQIFYLNFLSAKSAKKVFAPKIIKYNVFHDTQFYVFSKNVLKI